MNIYIFDKLDVNEARVIVMQKQVKIIKIKFNSSDNHARGHEIVACLTGDHQSAIYLSASVQALGGKLPLVSLCRQPWGLMQKLICEQVLNKESA